MLLRADGLRAALKSPYGLALPKSLSLTCTLLLCADPWCHPVRLFSQLNITDPWQDGRPQLQTEAGQLLFNRWAPGWRAECVEWSGGGACGWVG